MALLTIFSIFILTSASLEAYQICKKENCSGDTCTTNTCYNGKCQPDGSCACDSCWSGSGCQTYENRNGPKFLQNEYHTSVPVSTAAETVVATVIAGDADALDCVYGSSCQCGTIVYTIHSIKGNNLFYLPDERYGEIHTSSSLLGHADEEVVIVVKASNPFVAGDVAKESLTTIYIRIDVIASSHPNLDVSELQLPHSWETNNHMVEIEPASAYASVHHRAKRAAPVPSQAVPSAVTFYLIKTGQYENVTTISYGDRVHYQLWVQFPAGNTDISVEIFTATNNSQVILTCNPTMTWVGSNLNVTSISPVLDSVNNVTGPTYYMWDHATFDLGTVNNINTDTSAWQSSTIIFDWDVIMASSTAATNGTVTWVTAGGSYSNDTNIWVGQSSLVVIDEPYTAVNLPQITVNGPNTVESGTQSTILFDIFVPYVDTPLTVDVFSPNTTTTNIISICSMAAYSFGSNFGCYADAVYTPTFTPASSGIGNSRGTISFGTVVQGGVTDGVVANTRISMSVTVYTMNDSSLVGQQFSLSFVATFGSNSVYASTYSVTVVAPTATNLNSTPAFSVSSPQSSLAAGQMNVYTVTMKIPQNTSSNYYLEVYMPFNNSAAQVELCSVAVMYSGVNNPCPGIEILPVYGNRRNISGVANDYVTWNLGKITNSGIQSASVDPLANTITIAIFTQVPLNHTDNIVGAKPWITVGITYMPNKLWVGQQAITINSNDLSPSSTTVPQFSLTYNTGNNGTVPIGGAVDMRITITTLPNVYYTPMTLDFIMPVVNDTPVFTICFAEIVSVGRNMPCVNQTALNSTFQYTSVQTNVTNPPADRATVTLGLVCNTNLYPNAADNQITIRAIVYTQYHPSITNGSVYYLSVGAVLSSTRVWAGQVQIVVLTDMSLLPPAAPYISFVRDGPDNSTDVELGKNVIFYVNVKLPYGTTTPLSLSVSSGSPSLSICNIRQSAAGFGYPCMNQTCPMLYGSDKCYGNYTLNSATFAKTSYNLYLAMVSNIATDVVVNSATFDNSTVQLEIVAAVLQSADVGSSHTMTLTVGYAGGSWTQAITLTTVTPVNITTLNSSLPSFNFAIIPFGGVPVTSYTMAKSQAVRFQLDITVPPNSYNQLVVSFAAPVNVSGAMEVSDMQILSIGQNVPCMQRNNFSMTPVSRVASNYTDIGSINLGYVCQRTNNITDPMANTIRFRAVAKVTRRNTLAPGTPVWFSTSVAVNSDYIYVGQVQITVTDETSFTNSSYNVSAIQFVSNVSSVNLYWSPAQLYTIPLTVTVPSNCSLHTALKINAPLGISAVATLTNIQPISAGTNLALFMKRPTDDYWPTYNSTQLTSQLDVGVLDFGVITNTGITYETGTYTPSDDMFQVTVSFQMADALWAVNGSNHDVSFTLTIGQSVLVNNVTITAIRTHLEQPDLVLLSTANTSLVASSSLVSVTAVLYHSNLSLAEAYNVSVYYYLSGAQFVSLTFNNFTSIAVANASSTGGVAFKLPVIYFTDVIAWTFVVQITTTTNQLSQEFNMTVPYEVSTNIIYREGHENSSGTLFAKPLNFFSFLIQLPSTCSNDPLGLESGAIQDCQISGSWAPTATKQPQQCRIGGANGYETMSRSGNGFQPYLTINFGNVTQVTQIRTKSISSNYILTYSVYYSDDGFNWILGENVTRSSTTDSIDNLQVLYHTRQIKITIGSTSSAGPVEFQVEFGGCSVPGYNSTSSSAVCSASATMATVAPAYGYYVRGYLAAPSTPVVIYYCDANPNLNYAMSCYYATPSTYAWTAMPSLIINILGYYAPENAIYGLASDKVTYMMSTDSGVTWTTVTGSKYNTTSTSGSSWTGAVSLPWVYNVGTFDSSTGPTQNGYTALYDGLYVVSGNTKIVDWTYCCN